MIPLRHLGIIAAYTLRHTLRGGAGTAYLVLTLGVGLLAAQQLLQPVEDLRQLRSKDGLAFTAREAEAELLAPGSIGRSLLERLLGAPPPPQIGSRLTDEELDAAREARIEARRRADFLLVERPAFFSLFLLVLLLSVPFLVALGCFNQFSSDAANRTLRYYLLRTTRTAIYFGRFAAFAIYANAVLLALLVVVAAYMGMIARFYDPLPLFSWAAYGGIAMLLLSLPYVALCTLVSALVDSPFASFSIASLAVGGLPLLALLAAKAWQPLGNLKYLLPWGVWLDLLHPDLSRAGLAAGACLVYTAVFLALGYARFVRRDL